jgi:nifR3 family TIM-barrel protein
MRGETDIPVSVKLRTGWDETDSTYLSCAEAAVKAGAGLVCLHPRTRAQGFRGSARWEDIAALKRECPVPVIGSGDVFCAEDCAEMLVRTGCDGVMVARGALGNPFIFTYAREFLDTGVMEPIPTERRLRTALTHLMRLVGVKGEKVACREMRKHFVAYTKGMEGGAVVRQRLVHAVTVKEYEAIVGDYLRFPGSLPG